MLKGIYCFYVIQIDGLYSKYFQKAYNGEIRFIQPNTLLSKDACIIKNKYSIDLILKWEHFVEITIPLCDEYCLLSMVDKLAVFP